MAVNINVGAVASHAKYGDIEEVRALKSTLLHYANNVLRCGDDGGAASESVGENYTFNILGVQRWLESLQRIGRRVDKAEAKRRAAEHQVLKNLIANCRERVPDGEDSKGDGAINGRRRRRRRG